MCWSRPSNSGASLAVVRLLNTVVRRHNIRTRLPSMTLFRIRSFGKSLVAALALMWIGVLLGDAALIILRSPSLSLAVHCTFYSLLLFIAIGVSAVPDSPTGQTRPSPPSVEAQVALLLVSVLGTAVMFGLICRDLLLLVGGGFANALPGNTRQTWIAFGLDNTLECLLLDLPSIYAFQLTQIKPNAFWSQSVVMLFRLSVDFVVAKAIWTYVHRLVRARAGRGLQ